VFVWKWELSVIGIVLEAHAVISRSAQTDRQTDRHLCMQHAVILDCTIHFTYGEPAAAAAAAALTAV